MIHEGAHWTVEKGREKITEAVRQKLAVRKKQSETSKNNKEGGKVCAHGGKLINKIKSLSIIANSAAAAAAKKAKKGENVFGR
jgi:hypothetical protein